MLCQLNALTSRQLVAREVLSYSAIPADNLLKASAKPEESDVNKSWLTAPLK